MLASIDLFANLFMVFSEEQKKEDRATVAMESASPASYGELKHNTINL